MTVVSFFFKSLLNKIFFCSLKGADVNSTKHDYSYTTLHFAALSGSTEVCQLLLEHGAKTHATNSVGRTPSQMAAFVGLSILSIFLIHDL